MNHRSLVWTLVTLIDKGKSEHSEALARDEDSARDEDLVTDIFNETPKDNVQQETDEFVSFPESSDPKSLED